MNNTDPWNPNFTPAPAEAVETQACINCGEPTVFRPLLGRRIHTRESAETLVELLFCDVFTSRIAEV